MWEMISFLLFSTLEVFAVFVFMLAIFRMNALDFIWQALIIALLMGLQSHFLRGELDLGYLATVINLLCYVLLLTTVVKVPVLWAAIISCSGFFIYGTIQAILLSVIDGELLQLVTSILFLLLSYVLYKFGFGFAKDFERLRFKGEHILVLAIIMMSFVLMAITMYQREIWINIAFFAFASVIFLYYAVKKERSEHD